MDNLLLKELCRRLPYGVMVDRLGTTYKLLSVKQFSNDFYVETDKGGYYSINEIKPMLRPISSMTDEEISKLFQILEIKEDDEKEWLKINDIGIIRLFTGSGKSFTIKTLCEANELSYVEINAAQITKEGTSGNSISKALSVLINRGNKPTIVFVDEFDKLFISGNSNSSIAHEITTGVQNEFLKILESDTTAVYGDYGKYVDVSLKNTLFVFAGAFNNQKDITLDTLRDFGVKTEFLGRVGLVYNTKKLTLEDLYVILENSDLLERYLKLFSGVKREDVVNTIKTHLVKAFENNTLGARAISTLIHQYFIKGGKLGAEEINTCTFSKSMELGE